jgi:hypothetical protein
VLAVPAAIHLAVDEQDHRPGVDRVENLETGRLQSQHAALRHVPAIGVALALMIHAVSYLLRDDH